MTLDDIRARTARDHLDLFGAFHEDGETRILLGPMEPGFWAFLTASPEWRDCAPDPVDRWSRRVIDQIAQELNATASYPFGGPPYAPFYRWALASGEAWQSPVSLLVHARAGLMVSYRGAICVPGALDLPPPPTQPCTSCDKPCLSACPSGALGAEGYELPVCHAFLDTGEGQAHMASGCAVRRACPLSQSYGRVEAQSAYHMSQFHK